MRGRHFYRWLSVHRKVPVYHDHPVLSAQIIPIDRLALETFRLAQIIRDLVEYEAGLYKLYFPTRNPKYKIQDSDSFSHLMGIHDETIIDPTADCGLKRISHKCMAISSLTTKQIILHIMEGMHGRDIRNAVRYQSDKYDFTIRTFEAMVDRCRDKNINVPPKVLNVLSHIYSKGKWHRFMVHWFDILAHADRWFRPWDAIRHEPPPRGGYQFSPLACLGGYLGCIRTMIHKNPVWASRVFGSDKGDIHRLSYMPLEAGSHGQVLRAASEVLDIIGRRWGRPPTRASRLYGGIAERDQQDAQRCIDPVVGRAHLPPHAFQDPTRWFAEETGRAMPPRRDPFTDEFITPIHINDPFDFTF